MAPKLAGRERRFKCWSAEALKEARANSHSASTLKPAPGRRWSGQSDPSKSAGPRGRPGTRALLGPGGSAQVAQTSRAARPGSQGPAGVAGSRRRARPPSAHGGGALFLAGAVAI